MTEHHKKIILAYAANDMKIKKTAENLSYGETTIVYHLNQIHRKYGLNPRRFYDLVKLVEMAKES